MNRLICFVFLIFAISTIVHVDCSCLESIDSYDGKISIDIPINTNATYIELRPKQKNMTLLLEDIGRNYGATWDVPFIQINIRSKYPPNNSHPGLEYKLQHLDPVLVHLNPIGCSWFVGIKTTSEILENSPVESIATLQLRIYEGIETKEPCEEPCEEHYVSGGFLFPRDWSLLSLIAIMAFF